VAVAPKKKKGSTIETNFYIRKAVPLSCDSYRLRSKDSAQFCTVRDKVLKVLAATITAPHMYHKELTSKLLCTAIINTIYNLWKRKLVIHKNMLAVNIMLRLTAAGIRCADHVTPSIRKSWH
jgi:hypothetical protein